MAPETRFQDIRRIDDSLEAANQRINGIEVKLQAQSEDLAQLKTMMMELATQQIAIQQTLQTLSGEANSSQNREMKIWASASEEGWLLPKGFDSLNCIQTLELKSSAEPGAEEAFFNQVSSIRENRSDDKRFAIFTGTKRLHLRAEIREDRLEWMEALQAVKDMFPRMSNSELMAPMDNVAVSNELRKWLQEEGVREEVIQESEQIMRSEFVALHKQRVLLKHKQWLLTDTLRQLENFQPRKKKNLTVDRSNLGEAEEFSWRFPQFNLEDKVDFMDGALSRTGKGRAED